MKASEIFEYLSNTVGLIVKDDGAILHDGQPWLSAVAELRLDNGVLSGLWAERSRDENAALLEDMNGAEAYRLMVPAKWGELCCKEAVRGRIAANAPLKSMLKRLDELSIKTMELRFMPDGSANAVTARLGRDKLYEAMNAFSPGEVMPPLWERIIALCGGRAAITLRISKNGSGPLHGVRLKPERMHIGQLLSLLDEAGLCSKAVLVLVKRWQEAWPSYLPEIYNRLDYIELCGDGVGCSAIVALGMSEAADADAVAFSAPAVMNLELTTRCPLHCPQCYCQPNTGKDLALKKALYWISEARKNRVAIINLSGGETMCYPHLYEVVAAARDACPEVNVALSGWGLNDESYLRLIEAGVSGIYISLNGPTPEINAQSRDGFELAIAALDLLRRRGFGRTAVNWVMHNTNGDSLPQMLSLAEDYSVETLVVMGFKPDSSHALPSLPTAAQMRAAAKVIKAYDGPVNIEVEACFSQMRALVYNSFFGNCNVGIQKGCGAGRDSVSVNIDGLLSPCRHLDYFEAYETLAQYWQASPVLKILRSVEKTPREPCASCRYLHNCRHCLAINSKLNHELYLGNAACPLTMENKKT